MAASCHEAVTLLRESGTPLTSCSEMLSQIPIVETTTGTLIHQGNDQLFAGHRRLGLRGPALRFDQIFVQARATSGTV
jgi:hypothetical protein